MATTTGTASHQNDLLDDLKTFLTANGWTSLSYSAGATATDDAHLYLNAPGFGGTNQVYVNIVSENNSTSGYYGWKVMGALSYNANYGPESQAGTIGPVWFNTWDSTISYWMYCNDRRFIVVAKVNTSYISCYAGFFLPFATSGEYAHPLYVGGNGFSLNAYSSSNTSNRMIADPGRYTAYYRTRNGSNVAVANHDNTGTTAIDVLDGARAFMWPHATAAVYSTLATSSASSLDWARGGLTYLVNNASGESVLIPCHIVNTAQNEFPGALEGVYAISGDSRSSEGTISTGGVTYRLFENIGRSTNRDFMAIAEV
jgi:hypothetical protein